MNEDLLKNQEFVNKKNKFLSAMKSGREIKIDELITDNELMADKETVLCMLQTQGGDLLKHVSANLKDDEQVVFQACTNEGVNPAMNDATPFEHASERIKSSDQFMSKLKKYWLAFGRNDQAGLIQRYSLQRKNNLAS